MVAYRIYGTDIEQQAIDHIDELSKSPVFTGDIVIMPDAHEGKGAVIGFTGRVNRKVGIVPNVIGVDCGCGCVAYSLGKVDIDLDKLNNWIRRAIPMGFHDWKEVNQKSNIYDLRCELIDKKYNNQLENLYGFMLRHLISGYEGADSQLGTLGSGNHFIDLCLDGDGTLWIVIHSGSRNPGQKIATFYQKKAADLHKMINPNQDPETAYLPFWLPEGVSEEYSANTYLQGLRLAQEWANANRRMMIELILSYFDQTFDESKMIESVHNYIDFSTGHDAPIIRKGAISAYKDQKVIIPMNMARGSVIGVGKGNGDWNYSAPHGAGRRMSRTRALAELNVEEGKRYMSEMGVINTDIDGCIDELPGAYKDADEIVEAMKPSVEVIDWLKPVLNIKAHEEGRRKNRNNKNKENVDV